MSEDRNKTENEEFEYQENDEANQEADDHNEQLPEVELTFDELKVLCEDEVCPRCTLLDEEKNKALRALADSDNYKKRINREKEDYLKYAISSFVEDIIPVMDNLELALEHGRKNTACKDLVQGVEMTLNIFKETLEKNNLVQVGLVGEEFNPEFHEALGQEERDDLDHGSVCMVMQKGYVLNDRLLRPAKVMVSKKCNE